ncbi:unnamed protein product, partial [Iphiclides podalirius]
MREFYAQLLLSLVVCAFARPLQRDETHAAELRDLNFVAYVENFKATMADYVSTQYRHLTLHEREAVEAILEEFILDFGKGVAEVLARSANETKANGLDVERTRNHSKFEPDDGISEATSENIKATLLREFPDISDADADDIVYGIRVNLLATRRRLDGLIESSKFAVSSAALKASAEEVRGQTTHGLGRTT